MTLESGVTTASGNPPKVILTSTADPNLLEVLKKTLVAGNVLICKMKQNWNQKLPKELLPIMNLHPYHAPHRSSNIVDGSNGSNGSNNNNNNNNSNSNNSNNSNDQDDEEEEEEEEWFGSDEEPSPLPGHLILSDGSVIEIGSTFRFYLIEDRPIYLNQTKLPASPSGTTPICFELGDQGMEEALMWVAGYVKCPVQMQQYVEAKRTVMRLSREQNKIEEEILLSLCNSEGNLTENDTAVGILMDNKKKFSDNQSDISRASIVINGIQHNNLNGLKPYSKRARILLTTLDKKLSSKGKEKKCCFHYWISLLELKFVLQSIIILFLFFASFFCVLFFLLFGIFVIFIFYMCVLLKNQPVT